MEDVFWAGRTAWGGGRGLALGSYQKMKRQELRHERNKIALNLNTVNDKLLDSIQFFNSPRI